MKNTGVGSNRALWVALTFRNLAAGDCDGTNCAGREGYWDGPIPYSQAVIPHLRIGEWRHCPFARINIHDFTELQLHDWSQYQCNSGRNVMCQGSCDTG